MNLKFLNWQPFASNRDYGTNDWLGDEAWVTPQPFAELSVDTIHGVRDDDPADDWVPL